MTEERREGEEQAGVKGTAGEEGKKLCCVYKMYVNIYIVCTGTYIKWNIIQP